MTIQNESTSDSIAAVFATMSRPEVAAGCILALARQLQPPDLVVVAINDPLDGTIAYLNSLSNLPFELVLHEMEDNKGNAGGIEEVVQVAFERGADFVWILDDDSWPREEALKCMSEVGLRDNIVRHPHQVDPLSGRLTWPLPFQAPDDHWKLAWSIEDIPKTSLVKTRAAWTGALISRKIYDAVGPVNGELFIRGEDEEYPWRIAKAGFEFELVPKAVMDHPGSKNLLHWKLLGKYMFYEKGLSDLKLYYKVRNMVWLKKQQSGPVKSLLMALSYLGFATVIDGPDKVSLILKAIFDGWSGNLGRA